MRRQGASKASGELLRGLQDAVDSVLSPEDLRRFDQLARIVKDDPDPRFAIRFHLPDSAGWYLWARYRVRPHRSHEEAAGADDSDEGSGALETSFEGLDILTNDPKNLTGQVRFSVPAEVEGLQILPIRYTGRAEWPALIRVFYEDNPDHVAVRLGREAHALSAKGQVRKAVKIYDQALDVLQDVPDSPGVQGVRAAIMEYRAQSLERLGRPTEAMAGYDDVIQRYRSNTDPFVRVRVASSLLDKGNLLFGMGLAQVGFDAFQQIIDSYGEATDPELLEQVAFAGANRSSNLRLLGRSDEAFASYGQVADRFLNETDPRLVLVGASARIDQALMRAEAGDFGGEFDLIDALLIQLKTSAEPALQEEIARAMRESVRALAGLGKMEQARAALHEMKERFRASDDLGIREVVAQGDGVLAAPTAL